MKIMSFEASLAAYAKLALSLSLRLNYLYYFLVVYESHILILERQNQKSTVLEKQFWQRRFRQFLSCRISRLWYITIILLAKINDENSWQNWSKSFKSHIFKPFWMCGEFLNMTNMRQKPCSTLSKITETWLIDLGHTILVIWVESPWSIIYVELFFI